MHGVREALEIRSRRRRGRRGRPRLFVAPSVGGLGGCSARRALGASSRGALPVVLCRCCFGRVVVVVCVRTVEPSQEEAAVPVADGGSQGDGADIHRGLRDLGAQHGARGTADGAADDAPRDRAGGRRAGPQSDAPRRRLCRLLLWRSHVPSRWWRGARVEQHGVGGRAVGGRAELGELGTLQSLAHGAFPQRPRLVGLPAVAEAPFHRVRHGAPDGRRVARPPRGDVFER
mmetsp:Transcript_5296/g.21853  ORF Transcript_5296/g.21853 Transcript_5296/m.21853 type:complete len:231 (-) Transcript_5296:572-1264(-)